MLETTPPYKRSVKASYFNKTFFKSNYKFYFTYIKFVTMENQRN